VDLKNEIIKEHDCKQKLEEDFIQLRRVRSKKIRMNLFNLFVDIF